MSLWQSRVSCACLVFISALGGCGPGVSDYDDALLWFSMVHSPLRARCHPDRWDMCTRLNAIAENRRCVPRSLRDVFGDYTKEGFFNEKAKCGPFTVLSGRHAAMLLDEAGRPLWAGSYIFPMRAKGRLETLILAERAPGYACIDRRDAFGALTEDENDIGHLDIYRFTVVYLGRIEYGLESERSISPLGFGALVHMWSPHRLDESDLVHAPMDVSGKGDDMLAMVSVSRVKCGWSPETAKHDLRLHVMDPWGRSILYTALPDGVLITDVAVTIRKKPKIIINGVGNEGYEDAPIWKSVTYDPRTYVDSSLRFHTKQEKQSE